MSNEANNNIMPHQHPLHHKRSNSNINSSEKQQQKNDRQSGQEQASETIMTSSTSSLSLQQQHQQQPLELLLHGKTWDVSNLVPRTPPFSCGSGDLRQHPQQHHSSTATIITRISDTIAVNHANTSIINSTNNNHDGNSIAASSSSAKESQRRWSEPARLYPDRTLVDEAWIEFNSDAWSVPFELASDTSTAKRRGQYEHLERRGKLPFIAEPAAAAKKNKRNSSHAPGTAIMVRKGGSASPTTIPTEVYTYTNHNSHGNNHNWNDHQSECSSLCTISHYSSSATNSASRDTLSSQQRHLPQRSQTERHDRSGQRQTNMVMTPAESSGTLAAAQRNYANWNADVEALLRDGPRTTDDPSEEERQRRLILEQQTALLQRYQQPQPRSQPQPQMQHEPQHHHFSSQSITSQPSSFSSQRHPRRHVLDPPLQPHEEPHRHPPHHVNSSTPSSPFPATEQYDAQYYDNRNNNGVDVVDDDYGDESVINLRDFDPNLVTDNDGNMGDGDGDDSESSKPIPLSVDVENGRAMILRSAEETMVAVANNEHKFYKCWGCSFRLVSITDCKAVYCSLCDTVSPCCIASEDGGSSNSDRTTYESGYGSIGLGLDIKTIVGAGTPAQEEGE
mmetsp:Transcript_16125/g.45154  ORF Transcript_16125/g.45154 Transcript_16125/m.45154 type:complete len:620 (-) Transcript_16125:183-2042(-)|eukprot:CAMPEP_0119549118 /NCGR_PEP_ID=MMETSP1352-20130426/2897_1 /TAXON_ID=265584 /ORGANISM="Stauroneis constricta, Strain CCMP1120" /LENGTH=619 /DNA_ID=CAMNT_0007594589 /DNA_START=447 /DNA_END=2306 /DNA_ORIENTATION=-